jgi:hypothetical protein
MTNISSDGQIYQRVSELVSRERQSSLNSGESVSLFHNVDLLSQLEKIASKGETALLAELLFKWKTEYTTADLELFLHFFAYSESVAGEGNLHAGEIDKVKKNLQNIKVAFEISNAIKKKQES